jgi:NAD(P)H-hydrate epimerase
MKLLTASQIHDWDAYTILHEPISSLDLMERAASLCVEPILKKLASNSQLTSVTVLCGPGNNGGDGLVIARLLTGKGISVRVVYALPDAPTSADQLVQQKKLPSTLEVFRIQSETQIPKFNNTDCVVDALFGSGINKPITGLAATLIDRVNQSGAFVVAIDIPSGLLAEVSDVEQLHKGSIMEADITLTFQVPKYSFFHAECAAYTGKVKVLDIGLHPDFLTSADTTEFYVTTELIHQLIKSRPIFAHKGTFGHALMVAGSYGKLGAAVLSSRAALRSGCGLLTAYIPKVGFTVLQSTLPEAMVQTDDELYEIRAFPETEAYAAVGVGPGLGTHPLTARALEPWLRALKQPSVLDADALNIIAETIPKTGFVFPQNCVITPHPKEFDRLAGVSVSSFERLQKQRAFAHKHQVVVVLKGAYSTIALPDGRLYVNSTGNPALATGGSGDVLTGIITGLLAQHYLPAEAAILGVYLHGLCADKWVESGKQTMIAGDIVEMIPQVFASLI